MRVVVSLGAGVQSSAMVLMAARGEITPMPEVAIFADTQAEPQYVYDWLDWLEGELPFPIVRVTAGSLTEGMEQAIATGSRVATPPLFVRSDEGLHGASLLIRQCTKEYKIEPIRKELRRMLGLKPRQRAPKEPVFEQWMGISQDEIQRMKDYPGKWVVNRFPLIEKRLTRLHCLEWMRDRQYPQPQKSACTYCPYHDNATWREMKANDKPSWDEAVRVDEMIRGGFANTKSDLYLHRSLIPLAEVDLTDPAEDQSQFGFMDECDGMCGV